MEIQFRELRTQMKLAKARILIVMFVVVFVLAVKSRYNHHQEIIGLQDSLSNFYKDFDTSMFADLPALKKLLNKIQEMPEQLVKLEEIHKASESVRQKIEILQNFELDKTGRTDLALWNSGGRIAGIGADTKPFYSCNFFARLAGCPNKVNGPEKVIQSTMHPGECFRFQGNKGTVYIRLANDAILDAVTVEHLTMQMSPTGEVSSAPKEFSVSGLNSQYDTPFTFGKFMFDANKTSIEIFKLPVHSSPYRYVQFDFLDNNGHPSMTEIYRLRVHGVVLKEIPQN